MLSHQIDLTKLLFCLSVEIETSVITEFGATTVCLIGKKQLPLDLVNAQIFSFLCILDLSITKMRQLLAKDGQRWPVSAWLCLVHRNLTFYSENRAKYPNVGIPVFSTALTICEIKLIFTSPINHLT